MVLAFHSLISLQMPPFQFSWLVAYLVQTSEALATCPRPLKMYQRVPASGIADEKSGVNVILIPKWGTSL